MLSSLVFTLLSLAVTFVLGAPSHLVPTPALAKRAPAQVITKCTVPNTAALTFDDGPYVYLYDIGKALTAAGAVGTFFFNGHNFGPCIYDVDQAKRVKWAFDKGHQVASHTWSHKHLTNLTANQLHHEMWLVEEALIKITGVMPAFMRPPYGEYNDMVREVAGIRGQTVVTWDFDSGDTWNITTQESQQRYTDLIKTKPNTILALNHEVRQQTAQVIVPFAIKALKDAGYRLVSLAECLGKPAYQWQAAPQPRDASWTCAGKP